MRGLLDTKVTIPSAKEIAANTQNAIDNYALMPTNPSLPNTEQWNKMAKVFRITPAEVKRQRCANCEYYVVRGKRRITKSQKTLWRANNVT